MPPFAVVWTGGIHPRNKRPVGTRLAAAATTSRKQSYALCPIIESNKELATRTAKERRVAALWFLMLEGQSERIHFLQTANSKLLQTTELGQRMAGAQGLAMPKRSAERQKKSDRQHHSERVKVTVAELLRESAEVNHIVTLWDDDYYRLVLRYYYRSSTCSLFVVI